MCLKLWYFCSRSWVYSGDLVDLQAFLGYPDIDMSEYETSAFWSVLSTDGKSFGDKSI